MADRSNPHQRNLYQHKFGSLNYLDGSGKPYSKQLQKLSWPISYDLPAVAQPSAAPMLPHAYNTLHPMNFELEKEKSDSAFSNTYGSFGMHVETTAKIPDVHARLYTPVRGQQRPGYKYPVSDAEIKADSAFASGRYDLAISFYNKAISHNATLYCFEKRCAALSHVGRYQDALADAKHVVDMGPMGEAESGPAKFRVKAIEDFLAKQRSGAKGFSEAPPTLMTHLTPKDLRQWRSTTPSTYKCPYPFGSGMLSAIPQY